MSEDLTETARRTAWSGQRPAPREHRVDVEPTTTGVAVVDPIERRRERIHTTPVPESVRERTTVAVPAPVERAVELPVERLETEGICLTTVRDDDWNTVGLCDETADETFGPGEFVVDVASPIKLYLHVSGEFRVWADGRMLFDFAPGTDVVLAARSKHERPAATLSTDGSPASVREAVSCLGAALKTTDPDRTWPNHRGHPPAIEVGEEHSIPEGYEPPCPTVRLVVPEDFEHLYPVAPLAYYLGARVVPADGGTPHLRTEGGFEFAFDDPYEDAVERVLKQVFFVECLAREAGVLQYDLTERETVRNSVGVDFGSLFGQPPGYRIASALSIDYGELAPHVPQWEVEAYVQPDPSRAELLPHLLDELAVVRTDTSAAEKRLAEAGHRRSPDDRQARSAEGGAPREIVDLPETDALEVAWSGPGRPRGGSKVTGDGYRNWLDHSPTEPPLEAAVVCNSADLDPQLDVEAAYEGPTFPLEVSVYRDVSTTVMRTIVEDVDVDLLHYIGHSDAEGLRCPDGRLDLQSVERTGIRTFLLNSCNSYEQALGLVEAGAVGGVATTEDVYNASAVDVGATIARLLDSGFPLHAAVDVAQQTSLLSDSYLVVGDGSHQLIQPDNAVVMQFTVRRAEPEVDRFKISISSYPGVLGMGGIYHPHAEQFDYYLIGNETPTIEMGADELESLLQQGHVPVKVLTDEGYCLEWNTDLDLDDVESIGV